MGRSTCPTTSADEFIALSIMAIPQVLLPKQLHARVFRRRPVMSSRLLPSHPKARMQMQVRPQIQRFLFPMEQPPKWWLWAIAFFTAKWAERAAQVATARMAPDRRSVHL